MDQVLYAEVSTMSNKNIAFSLEAIKMKNFEMMWVFKSLIQVFL
jgi:hypothetical protein